MIHETPSARRAVTGLLAGASANWRTPSNLASRVSRSRGAAAGVRSKAGSAIAPGLIDSGRDALTRGQSFQSIENGLPARADPES